MAEIQVNGMSCQHCVGAVTKALEGLVGITEVSIDLIQNKVTYNTDGTTSLAAIKEAIMKIGFEPQ